MSWEYGLEVSPSKIDELEKSVIKLRNEIIMLNDDIKKIKQTLETVLCAPELVSIHHIAYSKDKL